MSVINPPETDNVRQLNKVKPNNQANLESHITVANSELNNNE
jgi:hypothetical protein